MSIWNKIKDALAIYKKGTLQLEYGTVINQRRLAGFRDSFIFETEIQTDSKRIITSNEAKEWGGLKTGNRVAVYYWEKINSKGEVKDYEFKRAIRI